jgi:CRP-like cAMP-binding protein
MREVIAHCKGLPERTFDAGEDVLKEGLRTGLLYILAAGSVKVVKGDFQINVASEPGSFFGEMSILLDQPHMATVRALEASRFYVVNDPRAFVTSHPDMILSLAKLLAKRLHGVTSYLVDLKKQFEDSNDHLGMVDQVLESLIHHQEED